MELVTRNEAAKRQFITPNLITHWVRIGRVNTYPLTEETKGYNRKYLVNMDEIVLAHKLHDWGKAKLSNPKLISPAEAAEELNLSKGTVFSWISKYNIKKHYLPGHERFFLIDLEEFKTVCPHEFK